MKRISNKNGKSGQKNSKTNTYDIVWHSYPLIANMIDCFDADASPTRKAVKDFFDPLGIAVKLICPQKWDINIFGWLKPERPLDGKDPEDWNEDLFISMANDEKFFASEYAARCSRAKFKVGRRQLKGKVFDLVVTNPEDKLPLQHVVFNYIADYLSKIQ